MVESLVELLVMVSADLKAVVLVEYSVELLVCCVAAMREKSVGDGMVA